MALRDVKNRLSEVVDQVEREHDRVTITRHGKAAAVVISADDLESLEETLKVASRPELMTQVRDSLAELAGGEAEVLSNYCHNQLLKHQCIRLQTQIATSHNVCKPHKQHIQNPKAMKHPCESCKHV